MAATLPASTRTAAPTPIRHAHSRRRGLRTVAFVLVLVGAAWGTRALRVASTAHYLETQRYEDVYYLPQPALLRVMSLGYDEALANLLWLKALLYFADELKHRGEVAHRYDYVESLLTLDPHFQAVYRWAAMVALYRTGKIAVEDAERAIDFLERGVRLFPNDGEMAWDLGATYNYELVPLLEDEAAKDEARRRGVAHMEAAVRLGAGPAWLVLNNAAQLEKLGQIEQAIRHLEETYATVRDEDVRRQIMMRLTRLRSAAYVEAFQQVHEALERDRLRDFPYLPQEMYLLVGPRPPIDGWKLRAQRFVPEASSFDAMSLTR